jgi:uncharacterized protein YbjT (DUF2867 family)
VYDLGGPEVLELRDIVAALAVALGRRAPAIVPLPMKPLGLLAGIAEKVLPALPVTEDQLKMLEIGSETSPEAIKALRRDFEIEHARLSEKAPGWFA